MSEEKSCPEANKIERARVIIECDTAAGRTRNFYELGGDISIQQRQQYESVPEHASVDGSFGKREQKPVGRPTVVVIGELVGTSIYPVSEPPPQLDIDITKIANVVTFKFLWDGEQVAEYDMTEQEMLTEEFRHHIDTMIKRAVRSIVDLGHAITSFQVHTHLERMASMQFGKAWMNSTLSQPLTLSKDG